MFAKPLPESDAVTLTTVQFLFITVPDVSVGDVKFIAGLIVSTVNVLVNDVFKLPAISEQVTFHECSPFIMFAMLKFVGVLFDDVLAGVYANLSLRLIIWLFVSGSLFFE